MPSGFLLEMLSFRSFELFFDERDLIDASDSSAQIHLTSCSSQAELPAPHWCLKDPKGL